MCYLKTNRTLRTSECSWTKFLGVRTESFTKELILCNTFFLQKISSNKIPNYFLPWISEITRPKPLHLHSLCSVNSVSMQSCENYFLRLFRSSRSLMFLNIDVLKNFAIFTRNHLCLSIFLIKLQACRPATLLKTFQHSCFPVNNIKFLIKSFLQKTSGGCFRLL